MKFNAAYMVLNNQILKNRNCYNFLDVPGMDYLMCKAVLNPLTPMGLSYALTEFNSTKKNGEHTGTGMRQEEGVSMKRYISCSEMKVLNILQSNQGD